MSSETSVLLTEAGDSAVRRSGVGSSDVATIAGLNPWSTPLELYLEKTGRKDPFEGNEATEFGERIEEVLLQEYAERQEVPVLGRNRFGEPRIFGPDGEARPLSYHEEAPARRSQLTFLLETLRHPEHDWAMAHVDGWRLDPEDFSPVCPVEAKTQGEYTKKDWGEPGSDDVPPHYAAQVTWQAWIARAHGVDCPHVDVIALLGRAFALYRVPYSEDVAGELARRCETFWREHVQDEDPPHAGRSETDRKMLELLYPEHTTEDPVHYGPGSNMDGLAHRLADVRAEIKEREEEKRGLENQIKEEMGELGLIEGPDWKVHWKKTKDREKTDWEAAYEELRQRFVEAVADPGTEAAHDAEDFTDRILEEHTETKRGYRMFRIYT